MSSPMSVSMIIFSASLEWVADTGAEVCARSELISGQVAKIPANRRILAPRRRQLGDGAVRLIDRYVAVGAGTRIGIGDCDISKTLAPDNPGFLFLFPLRIKQFVGCERVAVRPSIYRYAFDIACGVKTGAAEHTC